ncbi:MAG: AAA family ATPase [Thermoanaerobaculia bacterium]
MPARIVVLAGVNGAGKSSVAGADIRAQGGEFFDPDVAARALRDIRPELSAAEANAEAWELGRRGLERALARGEFFAFETTLGGKTIARLLLAGAGQGAEIHLTYVGLDSPELHIERVERRVAAGGHAIPEAKIRERYTTSRENLIRLLPHLALLRVYDNSAEADPEQGRTPAPILLLRCRGARIEHLAPRSRVPAWAKSVLAAALARAPQP